MNERIFFAYIFYLGQNFAWCKEQTFRIKNLKFVILNRKTIKKLKRTNFFAIIVYGHQ